MAKRRPAKPRGGLGLAVSAEQLDAQSQALRDLVRRFRT